MLRTIGLVALLAPTVATAAPQPSPEPSRRFEQQADTEGPAPVAAEQTPAPGEGRDFDLEIGFRGRMVSVPGGVLDIAFENERGDTWPLPGEGRPRITGYATGLAFLVKGEQANSIFYVEYIKSTMGAGYFDDRDSEGADNGNSPINGEYLEPSDSLGLVTLGANYAYEAHVVRSERTRKRFGWSLLVGGGLGVGFRTGSVSRWTSEDGVPAYRRYQAGEPPDGEKANVPPSVLPMVDINGGMRFTFGDRLSVRLEGGLHTLLYYGASVGLSF